MKPFNIDMMNAGKKVVDVHNERWDVALFDIFGEKSWYARKCDGQSGPQRLDEITGCLSNGGVLFIAGEKYAGWVNIYPSQGSMAITGKVIHSSVDKAKETAGDNCITQVRVEWED